MIDCPSCGAVVLPGAIVAGVAQCAACEHLFELAADDPRRAAADEAARGAPARPEALPRPEAGPVVLPSAPDGTHLTSHDHGLEITLSWRSDVNMAGHMVQVVLAGFITFAALQQTEPGAILSMIAVAMLLAYSWVYTLVNRTTVLVADGGVEVSHGPLPSFSFGASHRPAELRPLSVETVVKGWGRSKRTVYELHASRTATVILGDWNHRESVTFVRDCIEAVHDRQGSAERRALAAAGLAR